jgi:hypothetical protein
VVSQRFQVNLAVIRPEQKPAVFLQQRDGPNAAALALDTPDELADLPRAILAAGKQTDRLRFSERLNQFQYLALLMFSHFPRFSDVRLAETKGHGARATRARMKDVLSQ